MELVNTTPVPARLSVAQLANGMRGGIITAKATFVIEGSTAELDTQDAIGLSLKAEPTELGLLPADEPYLARDDRFEVVVLGKAHARTPVDEMRVALTVGATRRELVVTGDRTWVASTEGLTMSPPAPFTVMPLTWERAFGGHCKVELDAGAFVDIQDPINPRGRGFDLDVEVQRHAAALQPRPGFPKYAYERRLPNIERPDERIRSPEDRPRPACWATRPPDSGTRAQSLLDTLPDPPQPEHSHGAAAVVTALRSAADEWVIDPPAPATRVAIEGMSPEGTIAFAFPALEVVVDYAMGGRRGSLTLQPRQLVLLPEERRFYILYRTMFRMQYAPEEERSMRLRVKA